MIVDMHTHFFNAETDWGPQVFEDLRRVGIDAQRWKFTSEDHLRETAAADAAVVFGMRGARTGWDVPNDAVAEQVNRAPERLIFFASVDPGSEGCMGELEHCHRDLRCQGVKLGPIYQGVHPLDKRYRAIYEYCEKKGLPVVIHMATTFSSGVPLDYARPVHMDEVAIDYPELRIVMAHMGHPWEAELIAAIRKQPNLYADVSALYYRPWQFYNTMRLLTEYGAQTKVFFGSDYPATTTRDSLAGMRNVNHVIAGSALPPVPEEVVEGIIHRDALSILGIRPRAWEEVMTDPR